MKAQRKHELETNELENGLVMMGEFLKKNGAFLGVSAGVVVVGMLAYAFIFYEKSTSAPAGDWTQYFLARVNPDAEKELDVVASALEKKKNAEYYWSKLSIAELELADGTQLLFDDRKKAAEKLDQAHKNFSEVVDHGKNKFLVARARFGLGETLVAQNKPEDAKKQFEIIVASDPTSMMGKDAARSLKRLSSKENLDMLAWFAKQEPVKKTTTNPFPKFGEGSEVPGSRFPGFELPELPKTPPGDGAAFPGPSITPKGTDDIKFPGKTIEGGELKGTEKPATPSEETKGEEKTDDQPTEEKPATTPSTEAKP